MTPEVQAYLAKRKNLGWPDEKIRQELLSNGWTNQQIDGVLPQEEVLDPQQPRSPKRQISKKQILVLVFSVLAVASFASAGYLAYQKYGKDSGNTNSNGNVNTANVKTSTKCKTINGWQDPPCPNEVVNYQTNTNVLLNENINSSTNTPVVTSETYLACGCGCCTGTEPQEKCLYASGGDDLEKIKTQDQAAAQSSACAYAGCSQGIRYRYCDAPASNLNSSVNGNSSSNSNSSGSTNSQNTSNQNPGSVPGVNTSTNTTGNTNSYVYNNTNTTTNQNPVTPTNQNINYSVPPVQIPTGNIIALFNGSVSTQCSQDSDCTIVDKTKDRKQCCYNQVCTSFAGSQFVAVNVSSLASLDSSIYDFNGCFFEQCIEPPACSISTQQYKPACVNNLCVKKAI